MLRNHFRNSFIILSDDNRFLIYFSAFRATGGVASESTASADKSLTAQFTADFKRLGGTRKVYEKWYDHLGPEKIIELVHNVSPKCHTEGHDLGKVIFSKTKSVGVALRVCNDACYSGCMHGVFMEAFRDEQRKEDHVDLETLRKYIPQVCYNEAADLYRAGDCAHGVGHAVMYLSAYNISPALEYCGLFDTEPMQYYCATGAFMEYVTVKHKRDVSTNRSLFYPCDEFKFPAACFRYNTKSH